MAKQTKIRQHLKITLRLPAESTAATTTPLTRLQDGGGEARMNSPLQPVQLFRTMEDVFILAMEGTFLYTEKHTPLAVQAIGSSKIYHFQ